MITVADLPVALVRCGALAFGAVFGSFFTVAIYRWPREMSVVLPPSHCPACGADIPPWRNVPLIGYLLLRGRTACCGARLSPRYFLVELLTCVLAVAMAEQFIVDASPETPWLTATLEALLYFAFAGGLVIATFVDLEWMQIPDEVTLPGAALGLATLHLRSDVSAESAALGAGSAFLTVQVFFVWGYEHLTGRRGMGEGDAKLLMMIGAFLGWQGALFSLLAGAVQGLVAAIVLIATGQSKTPDARTDQETTTEASDETAASEQQREEEEPPPRYVGHLKIPFGPFLALGALEFLFFSDRLLSLALGE